LGLMLHRVLNRHFHLPYHYLRRRRRQKRNWLKRGLRLIGKE
jgi:hypothetical protein